MYGIGPAQVHPTKVAKLTVAVIDAFRSKDDNHNADRCCATLTDEQHELKLVAQFFCQKRNICMYTCMK